MADEQDESINTKVSGETKEGKTEEYNIVRKLGKGSFGTVYLVEAEKSVYVMKKIHLLQLTNDQIEDARKEIKFLSSLSHPNVIGYRGSFVRGGFLCIVMEYADGGDMHTKIQHQVSKRMHLPPDTVLYYFAQCCLALSHCHKHHLLHRDIKSQNIFLTKRGEVKIGDFGISRIVQTMEKASTVCGSPYYLSPEMVHGLPYNSKSDIWSLGVCFYEMCTLKHPFVAQTLQMLAFKILEGKFPPLPTVYPPEFTDLLNHMLEQDPEKRYSADQLLSVPIVVSAVERVERHLRAHQKHSEKHPEKKIVESVSHTADDEEDVDWKRGTKIYSSNLNPTEAKAPEEEKVFTNTVRRRDQLRSFLLEKIEEKTLDKIMECIRSVPVDASKSMQDKTELDVLKMLNERKELLAVIHTLIYLEGKEKKN